MLFPKLNALPVSRSVIDTFRGYDHNLRIGAGEFYDMQNMTGDDYPALCPRKPRRIAVDGLCPSGMIYKDALYYTAGSMLYRHRQSGADTAYELYLTQDGTLKKLISFGAYIIILPDKKWFNTADESYGDCDAEFSSNEAAVSVVWCKADGTEYAVSAGAAEPSSPENGTVWLDTSQSEPVLKMWYATSAMWAVIFPTYLKLSCMQIGSRFDVGDSVFFNTHTSSPLRAILGSGNYEISAKTENALVIRAGMDAAKLTTTGEQITVCRTMPVMDFCFEHENRLWGCRYGVASNGAFVNEIYASKLGDFKNWSSFQGVSTDSYIASCGTDGKWTGAIRALGYPLFFKENYLHKVYGSYPAEYQIQTIPCRGVQEGCEDSLAVVNEVLFYKSRCGVCAYDGSLPSCISDALGNEGYENAVAGGCGNKYYISMQDGSGAWSLFCFDTQKGFWYREDALHADAFCTAGGELFYLEHGAQRIGAMGSGTGEALETRVAWYAETGVLGTELPEHKYLARITVRLSMAVGARVRFLAEYDSCGSWEPLASVTGNRLNSFSVPLRPKRCDHLRLRIEGEGEAKLFSVTMTVEQGSDLR